MVVISRISITCSCCWWCHCKTCSCCRVNCHSWIYCNFFSYKLNIVKTVCSCGISKLCISSYYESPVWIVRSIICCISSNTCKFCSCQNIRCKASRTCPCYSRSSHCIFYNFCISCYCQVYISHSVISCCCSGCRNIITGSSHKYSSFAHANISSTCNIDFWSCISIEWSCVVHTVISNSYTSTTKFNCSSICCCNSCTFSCIYYTSCTIYFNCSTFISKSS